ncbi:hypothetical protein L1987_39742 [Smallanthus sonchifolius]|uniref:Uncharacterized protein n=1 Tax=Smallanthus sonchifolius TaxID=185202 RepID=A0ACB9HQD5_9ASTR|nr:hypothetical protein L1987_39742 [Smallanthus sonchifolius]
MENMDVERGDKVDSIIEKVRGSYAGMDSFSDSELIEMMVMDACFILEFIHEIPKDSELRLQDQHIPYDLDISSGFPNSTIHSVVELDRAGVYFKPNQDAGAGWPMAMDVQKSASCSSIFWFSFKHTLTMPILLVDDFTELVLGNPIAYEQSYVVYPYVTSYARAMDMLVENGEDIAKLVTSKVMVNHIGSNEEAAKMINGICKEVAPEHFCYSEEWEKVDIHFNSYWPSKIVNLKRTYFTSPWSIIALFAGIVLFCVGLVQTSFTVKST